MFEDGLDLGLGLDDILGIGLALQSEALEDSKAFQSDHKDVLQVIRDQSLRADTLSLLIKKLLQNSLNSFDQQLGQLHVKLHDKLSLRVMNEVIKKLLNVVVVITD